MVDKEGRIWVGLQVGGRNFRGGRVIECLGDDFGLRLPPGEESDSFCIEYGCHAHGNGFAGHIIESIECRCSVLASDRVKGDLSSAGVLIGGRLVEANMAGSADSKQLKIEPTGISDGFFVVLTMSVNIRGGDRSRGDVDIFLCNIDVIEKLLVHKVPVALRMVGLQAAVFVKVKCDDVLEAEFAVAVAAD